jgi:hypothetical protein
VEPRDGGGLAGGRDEVGWPRGRRPARDGGRVPGEPESGAGVHGRWGRKSGDPTPKTRLLAADWERKGREGARFLDLDRRLPSTRVHPSASLH